VHVVFTQLNTQLIYISPLHNTDFYTAAYDFEITTIPRFSGIPTAPLGKFTGSPQEYKYNTWTVQWIGTSKLLDSSDRSSGHTACG